MKTQTKILIMFYCFLLLFPMISIACPPPACPACYDGYPCAPICDLDYCCGGVCQTCCSTYYNQCPNCKICSSGSCVPIYGVASITPSSIYAPPGGQVTLTASPCPGASFLTGDPIWSSTTGSFVDGVNTGATVVWVAPTSSGYLDNIIASCGGQGKGEAIAVVGVASVSADIPIACVGETVTFTPVSNLFGYPINQLEWQKQYSADGSSWSGWSSASATLLNPVAGYYQYRVRNGSDVNWQSTTVTVVGAALSWTEGWAIDGIKTNGEIDLIVNPASVKASITDLNFTITPATTPYGNLEVDDALSTISQRDSDKTHWKVDKAIWYSDVPGINCPSGYVDYQITAVFIIDGKTFNPSSGATLRVLACNCPAEYSYCCGEAWANNYWAGAPVINVQQISANHWHATFVGQGDFRRDVIATFHIHNPGDSQFYAMIGAEEAYHKEQIEDADGSTTIGYYADYWDPAYVMDEIINVTYESSSQTGAITSALQAFLAAQYNEEAYCEVEMDSPDFYCDVEAEAQNYVRSQYVLMLKCAYPDCGD